MAHADGGVRLSDLAIPGTHDTMTSACHDRYYRTQHLTLAEQLAAGVRFLDLRLTRTMVAAHREWISEIGFAEIQATLADFLRRHPGETVLARIQNANEAKDDYEPYAAALKAAVSQAGDLFHGFGSVAEWGVAENPPWPTLDQARGKVVAIECSPPSLQVSAIGDQRWAANWHGNRWIQLQDDWDGPEVADKLAAITALAKAPGTGDDVLLLNHISATNGVLGDPAGYAGLLNPATAGLLAGLAGTDPRGGHVGRGVYIFDFVDADLTEAVIAVNGFEVDQS